MALFRRLRASTYLRSMSSLTARDQELIWHPFTQEKTAPAPIHITKGKGSYVYDAQNQQYLDLISSWWVNLHGHAHPEIANAIYKQSFTLEQVIFAGFTHEPAVELCESIAAELPIDLRKFFFSDNGSTAVEVGLKMAHQYWLNLNGEVRDIFLCFEGGYHGDTFGAMSVGRGSGYHEPFEKLLFQTLQIPFPETWSDDSTLKTKENMCLDKLNGYIKSYKGRVAALIMEPLVQGAAGMRMCRPEFVEDVVKIAKQHAVLVIFDEVMTGFGRTGLTFAFQMLKNECVPDILCLSKGITGGFLPLAVTVTTHQVYNAFRGDTFNRAFAHGHSYTANPIACAAGNKSFEILRRKETVESIRNIKNAHQSGLTFLEETCGNKLSKFRNIGTIAAFDVDGDYKLDLNSELKRQFLESRLLLRPLGKTVYLLPPYSTTSTELQEAYHKIGTVILSL